MQSVRSLSIIVLLGMLLGCGGGGGGSSSGGSSSSSSSSGGNNGAPSGSSSSSSSSGTQATGTLSCTQANTVQGFASLGDGTTGGAGGSYVVATTGEDIVAALASKKNNANPLIIYVNGAITEANSGGADQFDVKDMDNVSIIGVGNAGLFDGIGINIVRANNIIVRNVTVRYVRIGQKDGISIQDSGGNIWIDHNELYNEFDPNGSGNAANKDYYDELVSGKNDVDNITVSYNYLHDSWKTSLWGSSDTDSGDRSISFIANRWEHVNSRLPLFRFGEGHVLNNYYKDVIASGINSRMGANIRVEANYFEDVRNVLISMDSDQVGYWHPSDNVIVNAVWTEMPSGNCTSTPCAWGGTENTTQNGGEFTSTSNYVPPYAYTAIDGADVKDHVIANAGVNKVSRECLGVPEDIVEGEPGGSSSGSSSSGSSSSSSSSSTSGGTAALPFTEDFSASDATAFFTAAYRALVSDSGTAMYKVVNGGFTVDSNGIAIGANDRFTIGQRSPFTATTSTDTPGGDLDLSQPYTISFDVVSNSLTGGNFQIQVDNNTTSSGNSIHGGSSRIYSQPLSALPVGSFSMDSSVGTENSFIMIRCESGCGDIFIDNLAITPQ